MPLPGSQRTPLSRAALAACSALVLFLASVSASRGDLVLNEVLYDPDGTDEGREFVELWNPDSTGTPLDGVAIETADGARPGVWTVVWRASAGEIAAPRAALLVGAERLGAALQNGPDALRLTRGGAVLDLLGYGDLADAGLFEGAPAVDAPSGSGLARVADGADTGVNRDDWAAEAEPTPGAANHPDARLRFGRGRPSVWPMVPWPGEPFVARATVRNAGRLPLESTRWRLVGEVAPAAPTASDAWIPAAATAGVSLAPGESATVALSLSGPSAGAHRLRLRVEAPATLASATGGDGAAMADTATVWLRSFASPAVLSEIAYRNAGAGEWIEIWAREPIEDVGALTLADGSSLPRTIDRGPSPRSLAAGAYLVIAQDPAAVRSRYALPDSAVVAVTGGWPSLNDGSSSIEPADLVQVAFADGVPVDAAGYSGVQTVRGGSLERLSFDLPSGEPGTWSETIDRGRGTPGRPNSVQAPGGPPPGGRALLVAGARVLARRATEPAPIVLRATPAARGRRLTVRVHDLLGRPVRTLTEGQRLATDAAFVWDGRDERGEPAPPGLYVVMAEALPEDGAPELRSALSIAIAGVAR